MKRMIFLATVLLGLSSVSCGQSAPENVKEAFSKKFPDAKDVKWEKENKSEWEAEFKMAGEEYSANFSNEGEWMETEHEMKISDLPNVVKNTLSSEFDGYEVEEAEMVETPKFKGYELELEKGKSTLEVVFDANGKVLKKKEEKEDDDED